MKDPFLDKIYQGFQVFKRIPDLSYQYNERESIFQHNKVKLFYYSSNTKKFFPSGHIGFYVSDKIKNKLAAGIVNWLKQ